MELNDRKRVRACLEDVVAEPEIVQIQHIQPHPLDEALLRGPLLSRRRGVMPWLRDRQQCSVDLSVARHGNAVNPHDMGRQHVLGEPGSQGVPHIARGELLVTDVIEA